MTREDSIVLGWPPGPTWTPRSVRSIAGYFRSSGAAGLWLFKPYVILKMLFLCKMVIFCATATRCTTSNATSGHMLTSGSKRATWGSLAISPTREPLLRRVDENGFISHHGRAVRKCLRDTPGLGWLSIAPQEYVQHPFRFCMADILHGLPADQRFPEFFPKLPDLQGEPSRPVHPLASRQRGGEFASATSPREPYSICALHDGPYVLLRRFLLLVSLFGSTTSLSLHETLTFPFTTFSSIWHVAKGQTLYFAAVPVWVKNAHGT